MYTNILVELIESLSNKELMRFNKFLNSPYYNNRKTLITFFNILRKFHPDFQNKNFTKENIFKKMYGKENYNDSTFRNLNSDLLKSILLFLKVERMQKDDIQSSFFLSHELFEKNSYELFKKEMSKTETFLEMNNTYDGDYFYNRYKINTDLFYLNLLTKKVIKKDYVINESKKMIDGIIFILIFFIIESIKHNDNLLKYTRTYNIKRYKEFINDFLSIFNFENMIKFVNKNSSLKIHIVEIYYSLIKAFINFDDEKYYFEYKKALEEYSGSLGINDNNFLFSRLLDYCVMKINAGQKTSFDIYMEMFELNKIYIENEYYKTVSSKYIPFDLYRNVLLNCITVKKLDYMERFIKKYSKFLHPSHIFSVESYSMALYHFQKSQFDKALFCLSKIKFDQFVYKLDMKNLQLKIHFELEEYDASLYLIDSYKHFLKNSKLLTDSRRTFHNNFLSYVQKMSLYSTGSTSINLEYLYETANSANDINDKDWILQKIQSMINKKSNKGQKKMVPIYK